MRAHAGEQAHESKHMIAPLIAHISRLVKKLPMVGWLLLFLLAAQETA